MCYARDQPLYHLLCSSGIEALTILTSMGITPALADNWKWRHEPDKFVNIKFTKVV